MAKYDVYGIGNALVDTEFEVSEGFLNDNQIEKGLMTLVDENRQVELLQKFEGTAHKRSCGGSAANTVIAVSQLGGNAFYSCKVASDEAGDFYSEDMKASGVTSSLLKGRQPGTTGHCFVFVTPDADRTMNTHLGITETLSTSELDEESLKDSKILYMEGYLVTSDTGRAAAIKARELAEKHGVKTSLTFSDPGIVAHFKSGLKEMLGSGVDYIFCNEAEAQSFTDTDDWKSALEEMHKYATSVLITRGSKGAIFSHKGEVQEISAPQVQAVDTNGAGDNFAGSFLYGITNGLSEVDAASLACDTAAHLVTKFGARLDKKTMQEIKSLKNFN